MKLILIVNNFNIRKIEYGKDNSIRFIKKQKNPNTFIINIKQKNQLILIYLFVIKRILNI